MAARSAGRGPAHRVLVGQPPEPDQLLDPDRERDQHLLRDDRDATGERRPVDRADRIAVDPDRPSIGGDESGHAPAAASTCRPRSDR